MLEVILGTNYDGYEERDESKMIADYLGNEYDCPIKTGKGYTVWFSEENEDEIYLTTSPAWANSEALKGEDDNPIVLQTYTYEWNDNDELVLTFEKGVDYSLLEKIANSENGETIYIKDKDHDYDFGITKIISNNEVCCYYVGGYEVENYVADPASAYEAYCSGWDKPIENDLKKIREWVENAN